MGYSLARVLLISLLILGYFEFGSPNYVSSFLAA